MRSRGNVVLLALVLAVLGLGWTLRSRPTERNVEFLPQMVAAVPYESFAANPNFADGKTLRALPPHTVVRGLPELRYAATPEDARRAGAELKNPFAGAPPAALVRGAAVYANHCQLCHGARGQGDGPVAQRGFPAPPSLLADNARALPDGQLFHILTFGQGNMPGYGAQIGREDRWRAVLHVRELQAAPAGGGGGGEPDGR